MLLIFELSFDFGLSPLNLKLVILIIENILNFGFGPLILKE